MLKTISNYIRRQYSSRLQFMLICLCVTCQLAGAVQSNEKALSDIYRSGKMTISPVGKISIHTFPEEVFVKYLVNMISFKNGIVFADAGMHDLKMMTAEGEYIKTIGRKGRGPSELLLPTFLCESRGRLVVYEMMNKRFSYFSSDGKFLKTERPKINRRLDLIRSLSDGRFILEIYEVEANEEKGEIIQWRNLKLYSCEMKFLKTLYRQKEKRYHYNKKPPFHPTPIPYASALYWDLLPSDKLVVGFSETYKFNIINVDTGQSKGIVREYQPLKVTAGDKRRSLAGWTYNEGNTVKVGSNKSIRDNVRFPEYRPAYNGIMTDRAGHILIFISTKQDHLKKPHAVDCFDAFDGDGNFINHVKIADPQGIDLSSILKTDKPNVFWTEKGGDLHALETDWIKFKVN